MAEERRITYEELAQHKSPQSLWLLVHGRVYDVTPYLSQHPGGFSYLFRSGGIHLLTLFFMHFFIVTIRDWGRRGG